MTHLATHVDIQSFASGLPPEVAAAVHPQWKGNERSYWEHRDQLLAEHRGHWIAYDSGEVVVSGDSPADVLHRSKQMARHCYLVRVGCEDQPCRMRRVTFAYDRSYGEEPMPVIELDFKKAVDGLSARFDRVIVDTGADASAMPWTDCQQLKLQPEDGAPGLMGGMGQPGLVSTLFFAVWVCLDGVDYPCRLQADFNGQERILGRDVLNRLDVLFRGPAQQLVLNPDVRDG